MDPSPQGHGSPGSAGVGAAAGLRAGAEESLCFRRVGLVAVQSLWARESITRLLQRSVWLRDGGRLRTDGKMSVTVEVEWVQGSG